MTEESRPLYRMTLSLNVLNHLGIYLYSNVPSVLSEVVANAWDADATMVEINLDTNNNEISITDNGQGMSVDEVNERYLNVGFRRRDEKDGDLTPKFKRKPMGRKGIGKLSLFSIAKIVEIHTVKNGKKHGFTMKLDRIEEKIKSKETENYEPEPIDSSVIEIESGTKIILSELKKNVNRTSRWIKQRLARRFSVIGAEYDFSVKIDGEPVRITDRGYFDKVQFLWRFGENSDRYTALCSNAKHNFERNSHVAEIGEHVKGWIGTVEKPGQLKDEADSLNKLVIMVRGKLAQEDILDMFLEGRVFSKYLVGEIHADFLDQDGKEDIATSSRQKIVEDDDRFIALKDFLKGELNNIALKWDDLRKDEGKEKALEIPEIRDWFDSLPRDHRKKAKSWFGKIHRHPIEKGKTTLFKQSVLAFEMMKYKDNLDALEKVTPGNMEEFLKIFRYQDEIEASLYYQIVNSRLEVIETFMEKVETGALEKVVQKYLFDHLWLLDPFWERGTDPAAYMEKNVIREFGKVDANLTDEEKKGRVDIKYKTSAGKHLIIELKKADRKMLTTELYDQARKYRNALRKVLRSINKTNEPIEVVCLVGKELRDWEDPETRKESEDTLLNVGARVVLYQEMIHNAQTMYKEYLDKKTEAGRILKVIKSIKLDE